MYNKLRCLKVFLGKDILSWPFLKFIRMAQALNRIFFTQLARKILFLVNKMFMLLCSELNKFCFEHFQSHS